MTAFIPTIVVKKPDGTQVRMTMEEFKEYKKNLSTKALEYESTPAEEEKVEIEEVEQVNKPASEQVVVPEKAKEVEEKVSESEANDKEKNETKLQFSKPQNFAETSKKDISKSDASGEKSIPKKQEVKPGREDLPMINEHHELSTTTPVKDVFVDEAIASRQVGKSTSPQVEEKKAWTKEDHQSPLEDSVEELKAHDHLESLPDMKHDLFSEVLKKIKFQIPDNLQTRLHSLIASKVKEVRTDDQFLTYVMRSVDTGGLGLDDNQSQELLQTVKDIWHIAGQKKPEKKQATDKSVELPRPKKTKKVISKLNVSLPKSKTGEKPVMHDVLKPKLVTKNNKSNLSEPGKQLMGPIDEIKNFTLVDLRRMGDSTSDNFKKLLEKFKVLKKDSIVLYLEAVEVWYESPFYKQYQDLLFRSVEGGSKLKDLAVGGDILTWEEVEGVIKLQSNFS